jgi:hypothetical protein
MLPSDKLPIFFLKPNLDPQTRVSKTQCWYHDWLIERSSHNVKTTHVRGRPFNFWGGGGDFEKKFPARLFWTKKIPALTNRGKKYPASVFGGKKYVAKQHGCRDRFDQSEKISWRSKFPRASGPRFRPPINKSSLPFPTYRTASVICLCVKYAYFCL